MKDDVINGVVLELLTGFGNDRVNDKLFTRPFFHIQPKKKKKKVMLTNTLKAMVNNPIKENLLGMNKWAGY